VARITQRRQIRRAAEQALMTAFAEPSLDDSHDEDPHDDRYDPDDTPPLGIPVPAAGETYTTPIDSDDSELSGLQLRHWYNSKRGAVGVIAAAVLAVAVTVVLLVFRNGDEGREGSTTDSPVASTTAAPAPASAAPSPPTVVSPPALPPPPPPPSDSPSNPTPVITQPYTPPSDTDSAQARMPEIGVTRTPATRAPFSASPSPLPPPQYNQGDGRRAPCCRF
jgi:hypothetical protein